MPPVRHKYQSTSQIQPCITVRPLRVFSQKGHVVLYADIMSPDGVGEKKVLMLNFLQKWRPRCLLGGGACWWRSNSFKLFSPTRPNGSKVASYLLDWMTGGSNPAVVNNIFFFLFFFTDPNWGNTSRIKHNMQLIKQEIPDALAPGTFFLLFFFVLCARQFLISHDNGP